MGDVVGGALVEQYDVPPQPVEPVVDYSEEYNEYEGGEYDTGGGYDESVMDSSMVGTPSADGNKENGRGAPPPNELVDKYLDEMLFQNTKEFRCTVCPYKSKMAHNTRRHIRYVHLNYSDDVRCDICCKNFTRLANYREHIKSVHGQFHV